MKSNEKIKKTITLCLHRIIFGLLYRNKDVLHQFSNPERFPLPSYLLKMNVKHSQSTERGLLCISFRVHWRFFNYSEKCFSPVLYVKTWRLRFIYKNIKPLILQKIWFHISYHTIKYFQRQECSRLRLLRTSSTILFLTLVFNFWQMLFRSTPATNNMTTVSRWYLINKWGTFNFYLN